ncbi:MAG: two pore domain potassium channel family protein [Granulosicoccaceae bacterium]
MNHVSRLRRFIQDVFTHTPLLKMILLLLSLWLIFSMCMYLVERHIDGSSITSIGMALYWGIAAFSTAGIADTPISGLAQLIGGVWIILGSALFFGTIVATITTYFFRPLHRPAKQIIDTIEYNLEQMDDLTIAELELLKKTTDALIVHMEQIKAAQQKVGD